MAVKRCRLSRSVCTSLSINILCLILASWLVPGDAGAILHPLDGGGNFHSSVDVINRWTAEDQLDVMVLVEVANADIKFEQENSGLIGRLMLEVKIVSFAGEVVTRTRNVHTRSLDSDDAGSRTQFQIFGVLLKDLAFREGRVSCSIFDVNRKKKGILNSMQRNHASSECSTDWVAEQSPRPSQGVALEQPLFLVQAPLDAWNPDTITEEAEETGWLQDYAHPSRRYGVQQDHLQIFQPVWPQAGGIPLDDQYAGLRVEVLSLDMDLAIRDTVHFDARGRSALAAGRPAALFYELDVNHLPEGAYHLSLAPLDGQGRGSLTRFDVIWRLSALGKHRGLVLGEGHTVLRGEQLKIFLAGSPAEQEAILENFWDELNPDPESPINSVYMEFQYRVAYLQRFLGGFGEVGAQDERGEIFLLLGPADEIQTRHMPMNFQDQDDARLRVYDRFVPEREGSGAKESGMDRSATTHLSDTGTLEGVGNANIFTPYSRSAMRDRNEAVVTAMNYMPFEMWKYDNGGKPLFPNKFTDRGMGQRFLFIDQTGTGQYKLESSNLLRMEE